MAQPTILRVILIGDPPAADKVEHELRSITGVEVKYIRSPNGTRTLDDVVHRGIDYVLAMNTRNSGSMLRERCRQNGARMIPIPPSWSKTKQILEEEGFFAKLKPLHTAAPLTFRPFTEVKVPAKVIPDPVETTMKVVPPSIPVPPKPVVAPAPPLPVAKPAPVEILAVRPVASNGPPPLARAKGTASGVGKAADKMQLAEKLFLEAPKRASCDVNKQIAVMTGSGLSANYLRDARQRALAKSIEKVDDAKPTSPSSVLVGSPPKVVEAAAKVEPEKSTDLSEGVLRAEKLLKEELLKMGTGLRQYSFLLVGGEVETDYEMEVVRVVKKRSSL